MDTNLKLHHKLLTFIIVPICALLFFRFGWSAFSTIIEIPGVDGDMFVYYDISRIQFFIYTLLVSLGCLCFIILIVLAFFQQDAARMTRTLWYFVAFESVFVLCELFLQSRFHV